MAAFARPDKDWTDDDARRARGLERRTQHATYVLGSDDGQDERG